MKDGGQKARAKPLDPDEKIESGFALRTAVVWGTVLSSLVALPALSARPWADQRFILYWPEKLAGARPWRLISKAIDEIPAYLDTGNFRPVSRFGFYLEHWAVVRSAVASGIPPNVVMGFVKVLTIALLVAALLLTLDQYRRASSLPSSGITWRGTVAAAVVFFATSLVLFNPSRHPLTLFPGLYLGATGLVLLVSVWLGREWFRSDALLRRPVWKRWAWYGLWFGSGAMLASSIELAYVAVPLSVIHVVLLGVAAGSGLRESLRALLSSPAFRSWASMATGFLVVFIPTRVAITRYCADLPCYRATEPAVGLDFLTVLPSRMLAGFFPASVGGDFELLRRAPRLSPEYVAIGLVAAMLAGAWLWWARSGGTEEENRARLGAFWLPASAYLALVLFLASALGALSSAVQDAGFGLNPWRETGFVWTAWAGLFGIATGFLLDIVRKQRMTVVGVLVVVAALVIPSTIVNYRNMERVRLQPVSRLHIEAGTLLVNFDRSPEGNAQRCAVIDGILALGTSGSEARKAALVADFLDVAARNHWGRLYCDDHD